MSSAPQQACVTTLPLSEDVVRLAYLLLLGREVESDVALKAHMALADIPALRRVIMSSQEFRADVLRRRITPASKWVATDVLGQFTMWLNLYDRYVSNGCLNDCWEESESTYAASRLHAGDVMLDIGANIGWFSLLAAKHTGQNGRIYAFEPRPDIAAMLRRTVADNRLQPRISVYELALSDHDGPVTLQSECATDNPGHTFMAGPAGLQTAGYDSLVVNAAVLDQLLPELEPDFIKIDIEGAEPKALAGARNAITRRRPPILSELYPAQLSSVSGVQSAAYIAQLEELGYACYLLESGRPTRRLRDFPSDRDRELVSVVFESKASLARGA